MTKTKILGVILAGGESSRMGKNKANVLLAGKPLIQHVFERFSPQVGEVIISGASDFGLGVPFVPDADPEFIGPLSGIYSCALWARENGKDQSLLVTVPVDAPFLAPDLVARLSEKTPSIAATAERRHPTFANWGPGAAKTLERFFKGSPGRSLLALAEFTGAGKIVFDDEKCFLNINTRDDLEGAQELLT